MLIPAKFVIFIDSKKKKKKKKKTIFYFYFEFFIKNLKFLIILFCIDHLLFYKFKR